MKAMSTVTIYILIGILILAFIMMMASNYFGPLFNP